MTHKSLVCEHGRKISTCRCTDHEIEVASTCPYACEEPERLSILNRRRMLKLLSPESIESLDPTIVLALKLALRRDVELFEESVAKTQL